MRFLIMVILFFVSLSQAEVWHNQNSWNQDWENRYSMWVKTHWTTDFFSNPNQPDGRPNIYYGFIKDCADTVYSMRTIFSYENKLPFVMNDPTGGRSLISNQMSRFDNIHDPELRARKFLEYMDSVVSTRSLPNDTYPIAVNRQAVRSGALMMATQLNHHSWTIKDILPIGVPWLIFNTSITETSDYSLKQRRSWPNPYWIFEGDQGPKGYAGFKDWKPVDLISKPAWQIPGYSEEQYRVPLSEWQSWAQGRLALQTETNENKIRRLANTACESLSMRVEVVQEAVDYIHRNPRCMNYETYDIYSTPNRDQRLFDDFVALRTAYRDILDEGKSFSLSPMTNKQMQKIFPYVQRTIREETERTPIQTVDEYSLCPIEYAQGEIMDLSEAKRRLFLGLFSNNPHDEMKYRWGDEKGSSPLSRQCPSWDPWFPNLDQNR